MINITFRTLHKEILVKAAATTIEGKNGLTNSLKCNNNNQSNIKIRNGSLINIIESK